jgi:hypothetical protein
MLVTVVIGAAIVGAGQLLRKTLASTAKALLEVADMDTTLEHQANYSPSRPPVNFFGGIRSLPGNVRHHSRDYASAKRGPTFSQVGRPGGSISSVSYVRPIAK